MYGNSNQINQSSFRYINPDEGGSPELFYDYFTGKLEIKETEKMITGSMVHLAILEPEKFIVTEIPAMSETVKAIIEKVFADAQHPIDWFGQEEPMGILSDYMYLILQAAQQLNYGQSWKPETVYDKLVEAGKDYFEILKKCQDKICLSAKQKASIDKIVNSLSSNKTMRELLFDDEDRPGVQTFNELPLFFNLNIDGFLMECKAKIDRLIIDHENKTFRIIDLKTTSDSVELFPALFERRRIYRQLAFYEQTVRENYPDLKPGIHSIVLAESTGYNHVRRYDISPEFIGKGRQEYMDICNRIAWHFLTNNWFISREDYENDYIRMLELSY